MRIKLNLKKINLPLLRKLGYWFISGLLVVTAIIFAVSVFNLPGGYKLMAVTSGSMEPSINVGSIVLVAKASEYNSRDVVTYASEANKKETITHRVVHAYYPDKSEKPVYLTKGDANENLDQGVVKDEQIVGKVYFTIPYLGYASTILKKPYGFIAFVVIPATIIVYEEFKTLRKELFAYLKTTRFFKRKPGRRRKKELETVEINLKSKYFIAVPVIAAAIAVSAASHSFFFDSEASTNNTFVAGVWVTPTPTPPPIAQTLVINEILPVSDCNLGGGKQANWIELWNGTNSDVNLKNFKISDGTNITDLVNSSTILPSGQFALIAKDGSVFGNNKCYPDNGAVTVNLGNTSPVSFTTGTFKLLQADGVTVIDKVRFNGVYDGVNLSPSADQSLERVPNGHDSVTGDNFLGTDFIVKETATPGYGSSLLLNEFVANPGTIFSQEWVEVYNPGPGAVNVSGWKLVDEANHVKDISSLGSVSLYAFIVFDEPDGWLNNTGGDILYLKDSAGKIIDSHKYTGNIADDKSLGRRIDGASEWLNCTSASKGTTNTGVCQ